MSEYYDGGSMTGAGLDDRDQIVSFTCVECHSDNDDIDGYTDGLMVWAVCVHCKEHNEWFAGEEY